MTRLVRIHLGTAPGTGTQDVDQCGAFRPQLRSVLPAVDGASLLVVSDCGRMSVEAVCDADKPGAGDWGRRAAELAPDIW